jgi:hypothetical protein
MHQSAFRLQDYRRRCEMLAVSIVFALLELGCAASKRDETGPSIQVFEAPAQRVQTPQKLTIVFSVDRPSRYVVRLLGANALLFARGEIGSGEPVTITIASEALAEGENQLRLEASTDAASSSESFTVVRDVTLNGTCSASDLALSVTPPPLSALHYGIHDTGARTLVFTHAGSLVECSHDDGLSYATCDTANTLVFTPDDYALGRSLVIRASQGTACSAEYRYNPKTEHPNAAFHACDVVVSADESLSALASRVTRANLNVCVAAGIKFAAPGSPASGIRIEYSDVRVLGVEGVPLQMVLANLDGFYVSGVSGFVLAHADVQMSGSGGYRVFYAANVGAGTVLSRVRIGAQNASPTTIIFNQTFTIEAVRLQGVTMDVIGNDIPILNDGYMRIEDSAIRTTGSSLIAAPGSQKIDIVRSTLSMAGGPSGAIFDAFATQSASSDLDLLVQDSTIENQNGPALLLDSATTPTTATLTHSKFIGTGGAAVLQVRHAQVTLTQSTVRTASNGIALETSGAVSSLQMHSTQIRRSDVAPAGGVALGLVNAPTLDFGGTQANLFCDEGTNGFGALVAGTPGNGSYVLTTHHNQTQVACPVAQ